MVAVAALTVHGLSIVKPPYGVISAINLDRGDIQWQVPYGETPDAVRNHPALKGMNIGNTGQRGSVGLLVTKTLVILGDSQMTTTRSIRAAPCCALMTKPPARKLARLHAGPAERFAYDLQVGRQAVHRGRVSGGTYSGEYIAYALPEAE